MKILIMGLPGSGKTSLAKLLAPMINAVWLNADEVRKQDNNWDFSEDGRRRQSLRMRSLAEGAVGNNRTVVADFHLSYRKNKRILWCRLCHMDGHNQRGSVRRHKQNV